MFQILHYKNILRLFGYYCQLLSIQWVTSNMATSRTKWVKNLDCVYYVSDEYVSKPSQISEFEIKKELILINFNTHYMQRGWPRILILCVTFVLSFYINGQLKREPAFKLLIMWLGHRSSQPLMFYSIRTICWKIISVI